MVYEMPESEPGRVFAAETPSAGPRSFAERLRLVRGLLLLSISFATLFVLFSLPDPSPAQVATEETEPDFPLLFRAIDRRLKESYLDLERIEPERLVRRALSSLELAAEEIYVEDSDPANPYVPVHVSDKTQVFTLNPSMEREEAIGLLEKVFEFVRLYYHGEKSLNDLRYAAANGFLSGIDPHTLVFSPKSFEDFELHIKGEIYGVGMLVGIHEEESRLEVKQVLKETPAFEAGFRKGDLIIKIDDESTINMTVPEAVEKIRGPRNTEVALTVRRRTGAEKKESETLTISVRRDRVEIKSVESALISDWNPPGNPPGKGGVGYVQVTNFDQNTYASLRRNLNALREANGDRPLAGLILDLRGNSGGLMTQAVMMADLFLEEGEIVGTAFKDAKPIYKTARKLGTEPDYPIIVLSDEGSASGAEIVIGALQKNDRALVIGRPTFGKGSVQQLHELPNGAQLKITVSEYLLPGKVSIQETGVVPDVLALPVVLEKGRQNLFPSDGVMKEKDYEAHLVSRYKVDEEPKYTIKYLYTSPDDESESVSQQERFISGDLRPQQDPLVQMGLKVLALAEKPFRPQALLAEKRAEFESLGAAFYDEIVARLGELEIDWTSPELAAAPPRPDLDLELEHEFIEEKPEGEDDEFPVNYLVMRARLTNRGEQPLWRLKGLSRSEYYLFEDREFLFGKVAPGAKVSREVRIRLPYFPRAQNSGFTVEVSGADDVPIASRTADVQIEERPRPELAYSATLLDQSGSVLTRLDPGTDARLAVRVTNVGRATAHEGVTVLRNRTGREIFLKDGFGRLEFSDLEPGETQEVEFRFEVREGDRSVDAYDFEFAIVDSYSSANLSRRLVISRPGKGGEDFPNGKTFQAPEIAGSLVDPSTQERVWVTDRDRVQLRTRIRSQGRAFRAWATAVPVSATHGRQDKFFFDDSRGIEALEFSTPVELSDGMNLVTVVARDREGIEARQSFVVRKRGAPPAATTTAAQSKPEPEAGLQRVR